MKKLRSFIYIDNYKMYSISSQLFEGLTEYIVQSKTESIKDVQSEPKGNGRILADIIEKEGNLTEKKFLHDFSYNLFEDELVKSKRVLELDLNNIETRINEIHDFSFIKITGKVAFNDLKIMEDLVSDFNKIGESLGYISYKETLDALKKQYNTSDFKKHLLSIGLQHDQKFLDHLAYILDYGYNQQFEIQIPLFTDNRKYYLFSAQLNRENLKDNEQSIIKKYSRETEKDFKLFGILTQTKEAKDKVNLFKNVIDKIENDTESKGNVNMKEAIMNMIAHIGGIEKTFTGKLDYEYIIDPIALYIEI